MFFLISMIPDCSLRYLNELGVQGDCPIHFTQDELESRLVDAEGWNEVQEFFDSIHSCLLEMGW